MTAPEGPDGVWDLVVVGAGPAGATAALAARRARPEARVLLLDRSRFPRDKCCGDGVAPHVMRVLEPLGAADVVRDWTPLRRLELARGTRSVEGRLAGPVWVVPRKVLDARLVEHAVTAGAVLEQRRVRRVAVEGDAVVLDDAVRARVVVGADGAHSVVRAALTSQGGTPEGRRAIAVRGYAPTPASRSGRQVIRYGGRRQPSYAWAFDRGDGWSNVGYGELVDDEQRPTRALLLEQLEQLLPGAADGGERWRGHPLPLSGRGWGREQPDGRILLVGDAAGLVNPLTGEGIYYAVATGALAGRAAVTTDPADAGAAYRTAARRLLDRHLWHTWAAARLSRRPAMVDAGIHAARRDPRAFDALVELGLGDGRITPRLAGRLGQGLASGLTEGLVASARGAVRPT